jgi:hypothetical protein
VTEHFKLGDKIAAAALSYKRAHLRVGVVEKIHEPTRGTPQVRYTIRDDDGVPHIVSHDRAVGIERDEHHTMDALYEYRMLYHSFAVMWWREQEYPVVKSWKHSNGEDCFGGGWFIVVAILPEGQVSNHYRAAHWDLFDVPEVRLPPEFDGHTPSQAADRIAAALAREKVERSTWKF